MNNHDPDRDPLDEDERELARIVRALPGGEPPPALDALILKAAQDAVATSPSRRVRRAGWLSVWSLGSAAAAVLAVGVGWQLNRESFRTQAPAAESAPATPPTATAPAEDTMSVDIVHREPKVYDNSPPPPPPQPARAAAKEKSAARDQEPQPFIDEHVAPATAAAEQAAGQTAESERRDGPALAAPAPMPQAAPAQGVVGAMQKSAADAATESDNGLTLDKLEVTGSRMRQVQPPGASPRVDEDLKLGAADWLQKIRERLDRGDLEGARASFKLFQQRYPGQAVPEDIRERLRG